MNQKLNLRDKYMSGDFRDCGLESAIMEAWHTCEDIKTVMNFNGEDAYLHMDTHIADKVVCDKLIEELEAVRKLHDIRMGRLHKMFTKYLDDVEHKG